MSEFVPPTDPVASHYRILEKLGEGGMGVVYRAHDDRLSRDVALKFLPAELIADPSAHDLLIHEARMASALNHPNICTVYDIGQAEGRDYIVMEYLKGASLAAQIRQGVIGEETAIRYGEQIADALAHAHEQGVIHRDLKTANIMITTDGRIKVLDFGLAKRRAAEGADDETRTNNLLAGDSPGAGTLHYTAPEILRGDSVDARSDIWSLGVVLYEITVGDRPFHGRTGYELTLDILYHPPKALPAKILPALRATVERCLEKSPLERYQHAIEVRAALATLRSHGGMTRRAGGVPRSEKTSQRRSWLVVASVIVLAMLLATVGALILVRRGKSEARADAPVRSLAVLPLENMSGDPSQEFFADGMTEELTTQLAELGALRVISRTSMEQYRNSKKSLPTIAKELGVDAVVEGSVLRSGDRVRITAQLIQAATEKDLWAHSYEGDARDVLGLQRNVAQAIANQVQVQLTPQEQERLSNSQPVSPSAHEAYLKGDYLNKGTGAQQLKAKQYFDEAIRIAPDYAPAYAGLANYFWSTPNLDPQMAMPSARANALKALELDPDLAQAHTTVAAIHFYADWDFPAAEKELKRALELNPSDAETHRVYSFFLAALGRVQESIDQSQQAQELDPLSTSTQVTAGWVFYWARQYDKAVEQCQSALELDSNSAGAYDCLGASYRAEGRYERAIAASRRAVEISEGDAARMVGLASAYAVVGRRIEAEQLLEQIKKQSTHSYVPPYLYAVMYAALGHRDQAFAYLEKAYTERDRYMVWLNVDGAMDSLRSDRRFDDLVHRMGLSPGAK